MALAEESIAAAGRWATPIGSPMRSSSGDGPLHGGRAPGLRCMDEGVDFVRQHHVQFFEGFLARDAAACTPPTERPEPAGAVRRCHRRLPACRQRAAAHHHPGERAGAVRTARPSRTGRDTPRPLSRRTVERPPRARARRDRREGRPQARHDAAAELESAGAALDLGAAAAYALRQIDIRAATRTTGSPGRPGGLSRREVEVLRLVADGRTSAEIATSSSSRRERPTPLQNIYTKIGVSEPRRGDSLGHPAPGGRQAGKSVGRQWVAAMGSGNG